LWKAEFKSNENLRGCLAEKESLLAKGSGCSLIFFLTTYSKMREGKNCQCRQLEHVMSSDKEMPRLQDELGIWLKW
jgi:hypothetical protein